jgi:Protein of unknown function (DUF2568)
MEVGVVAALAYWGADRGHGTAASIVFGIAAPVVGFGFWGAIDFRQAGRFAEPLRLTQELAVSGLAAVALYRAGEHNPALALGALSLVYHALVYACGSRLLPPAPRGAAGAVP